MDVVLGREARMFVKSVMSWVRAKMSFAILRVNNLCLRGCTMKRRRVMDINDGAGLPGNMD